MREQQTLDQAFGTAVMAAAQRAPLGCVLVLFCAAISLLLGLLTAYHVYLTSINQTTNENVRRPVAGRSQTNPELAPALARARTGPQPEPEPLPEPEPTPEPEPATESEPEEP